MSDDSPPAPTKSHGRISVRPSAQPRDLMADPLVQNGAWRARVITLFPDAFPGVLGLSLTGRALDMGLWALDVLDLRAFGQGRHRNVDDTPAGGGAGMVLRADVLEMALHAAAEDTPRDGTRWPVIYLSPRGRPMTQVLMRRLAGCDGVTLLCGRFEGVDQRVLDHFDIEEISLGDFVMTGGEIAAQALIDATVRLRPNVLGNMDSMFEESFSDGLLEHPQYTRPAIWQGMPIPDVLTSGNHAEVAKWRRAQAEAVTRNRRPDLWAAWQRRGQKA
jgi:tRNA (guanine37-N1)-methyltransferase